MGKVVVFEGPDKVGKETQSKLLANVLKAEGFNVIRVEPSKEAHPRMKKLIYAMLEDGRAKRYPNAFQFVQFLNKVYFQTFKLPKLKKQHDLVILDRWKLSGYVYGGAEGINPTLNKWMYNRVSNPDITLVLSGTSYKRSTTTDDSYERDTELQTKVKIAYRDCGRWPGHALVDNHDSVMDVHNSIRALLENLSIVPSSRCPVCKAAYNEPCEEAYHR